MRHYKILIGENAFLSIYSLEKNMQKKIFTKLTYFEKSENPFVFAKKLKDINIGQYRFRVGDYRIFFDTDVVENITYLKILTVKHRKDAYK